MTETAERYTIGKIMLAFDDIFDQEVDAIVNPANTHMLHGGGLAASIAYRAGSGVVAASQSAAPIDTGEAIFTQPGDLTRFKGIIHAVGPHYAAHAGLPQWRRTRTAEPTPQDTLLHLAYYNSMRVANEEGCASVAFPAISCGVFRYPVRKAAPIAIQTLRQAHDEFPDIERSIICVLDDEHWDAFKEAMDG